MLIVTEPKYSISYPNHKIHINEISQEERNDNIKINNKNRTAGTFVHKLELQAPNLDRNFTLELVPNPNLLASNFVVLETFSNQSQPLPVLDEDINCYYRGEKSALSLCNGIVSI